MGGLWVMRHGRSRANAAGVVCSRAGACTGLVPEGQAQARAAGLVLLGELPPSGPAPMLLTSPFKRAQETAAEVLAVLREAGVAAEVEEEPGLAERWFGELEGAPDSVYPEVWADDARDPSCAGKGVESVASVAVRTKAVLEGPRLAALAAAGRPAVLVAHGDTLSILCASHSGSALAAHRDHGLPPAGLLRLDLP